MLLFLPSIYCSAAARCVLFVQLRGCWSTNFPVGKWCPLWCSEDGSVHDCVAEALYEQKTGAVFQCKPANTTSAGSLDFGVVV